MRGLCVELDYRAAPELIWERAEIYCLFGRCCLWRRTGGSRGAISLRINLAAASECRARGATYYYMNSLHCLAHDHYFALGLCLRALFSQEI